MADISTKKIIEIWDERFGNRWIVQPDGDLVALSLDQEEFIKAEEDGYCFNVDMIGALCKALHEVAQNVIENNQEDDG